MSRKGIFVFWVVLSAGAHANGSGTPDPYRHLLRDWPSASAKGPPSVAKLRPLSRTVRWERYEAWRTILSQVESYAEDCPATELWVQPLLRDVQDHVHFYETNCLVENAQLDSCADEGRRVAEISNSLPRLRSLCDSPTVPHRWYRTLVPERRFQVGAYGGTLSDPTTQFVGDQVDASWGLQGMRWKNSHELKADYRLQTQHLFNLDYESRGLYSSSSFETVLVAKAQRLNGLYKDKKDEKQSEINISGEAGLRLSRWIEPEVFVAFQNRSSKDRVYSGGIATATVRTLVAQTHGTQAYFEGQYKNFSADDAALMPSWRSVRANFRMMGRSFNGAYADAAVGAEERRDKKDFVRLMPYAVILFSSRPLPQAAWAVESITRSPLKFTSSLELFYRGMESRWSSVAQATGAQGGLLWKWPRWSMAYQFVAQNLSHYSGPGFKRREREINLKIKPSYSWRDRVELYGLFNWERRSLVQRVPNAPLWLSDASRSAIEFQVGINYDFL